MFSTFKEKEVGFKTLKKQPKHVKNNLEYLKNNFQNCIGQWEAQD